MSTSRQSLHSSHEAWVQHFLRHELNPNQRHSPVIQLKTNSGNDHVIPATSPPPPPPKPRRFFWFETRSPLPHPALEIPSMLLLLLWLLLLLLLLLHWSKTVVHCIFSLLYCDWIQILPITWRCIVQIRSFNLKSCLSMKLVIKCVTSMIMRKKLIFTITFFCAAAVILFMSKNCPV